MKKKRRVKFPYLYRKNRFQGTDQEIEMESRIWENRPLPEIRALVGWEHRLVRFYRSVSSQPPAHLFNHKDIFLDIYADNRRYLNSQVLIQTWRGFKQRCRFRVRIVIDSRIHFTLFFLYKPANP